MATNVLTAEVRMNVGSAEKSLDSLIKKLQSVQDTINNLQKQTIRVDTSYDKVYNTARKVNTEFHKSGSLLDTMIGKVRRLASIYLGVMGMQAMVNTSDSITSAENRLNNVNAEQIDATSGTAYLVDGGYTKEVFKQTQDQMDKMFVSANKVRMGYTDMMANVAKSISLAGDAFQNNTDNAIRFQEIMAESYALGGASAAEMSSSMYQMIQALGSGILQGDELRSVREGAPLAYKAIEEFAQKLYDTDESLKELASDGMITSDIVVAAITSAGDEMDAAFQNTSMTFAQAWTNIKNTAVKSFEPILQMMNDLLNSDVGQKIMSGITTGLRVAAMLAGNMISTFEAVFTWFSDNWDWLKYVAIGVLGVITMYLTALATQSVITGTVAFISGLKALAPYLMWVAIIGAVIAAIVILANVSKSGCEFIFRVAYALAVAILGILTVVAIVYLATGTMIMSTTMTVVLAIIAVLAIVVMAIMAYGKQIGAFIGGAISVIWNLFVTLLTAIISDIIVPLATAWDVFANFFGNIFTDPAATCIRTIETMANSILGILKNVASAIDAIFGSNLASSVGGWINGISSKADELVEKYGNGSYEEKSNIAEKLNGTIGDIVEKYTWDTSDAITAGANVGSTVQDWVNDKFNTVKDFFGNLGDSFDLSKLPQLPTMDSTAGMLNTDDITATPVAGDIDDTAKNTANIADTIDLADEDLDYLRKIAEMEWKKEFTTAEIKVDMSNYNTVSGDTDLDGIVTTLTDKLYEELNAVANGVYV